MTTIEPTLLETTPTELDKFEIGGCGTALKKDPGTHMMELWGYSCGSDCMLWAYFNCRVENDDVRYDREWPSVHDVSLTAIHAFIEDNDGCWVKSEGITPAVKAWMEVTFTESLEERLK